MNVMSETVPAIRTRRRRRSGWLWRLLDIALVVLVALLVSMLLRAFVVRAFEVPTDSMSPTIQVGDRILVDELSPRWSPYERGDIIVFRDPGGWLDGVEAGEPSALTRVTAALTFWDGPVEASGFVVKRIIGLPGDTVACCNDYGQLSVNGAPIDERYTTLAAGDPRASRDPFSVTVPEGAVWVLGDNRRVSLDSRFHQSGELSGAVPLENVIGRATAVIWPFSHLGWIPSHGASFAGVEQ